MENYVIQQIKRGLKLWKFLPCVTGGHIIGIFNVTHLLKYIRVLPVRDGVKSSFYFLIWNCAYYLYYKEFQVKMCERYILFI